MLFITTSSINASGILVPNGTDPNALRIVDHLVKIDIQDQVALTDLTQIFENTTDQRLEGTYIFPIPEGADLTDFQMSFNGKMVQGEVLPADEARQIYESIVRRQQDPGLIEFIGRRLLRARIFPIEPHSKTEIKISYQQVVDHISGLNRYRYPLKTPGTTGKAYGTVRFSVLLESQSELKTIWSPTHTIEVVRNGDHSARAEYEKSAATLDEDFILLYNTDAQDVGLSLVAHKPAESDDGHFLLILTPKAMWENTEENPQDYVFVVDTSGSMAGEKIEQTRAALTYCIDRLKPNDRFSIVRFSSSFDSLFSTLKKADDNAKSQAKNAIEKYHAAGGTNIHDALQQAIKLQPENSDRPFVIIFLTDGLGDRPAEDIHNMLAKEVGDQNTSVRIFPFGVGHDVDTKVLDGLAGNHSGMPTYVQPGENLEYVLGDFFDIFSQPVLTNLTLTLPDAGIVDKFPPMPGDLYHGRQLILTGRFSNATSGKVILKGNRNGEEVTYEWNGVQFKPAADHWYVSRIWAGRKIAYLLDRVRQHGENDEIVTEIVQLAKAYGIQTPYTSWLVAPEEVRHLADGSIIRRRSMLGTNINFAGGSAGRRGAHNAPSMQVQDALKEADSMASAPRSAAEGKQDNKKLKLMQQMSKGLDSDAGEMAVGLAIQLGEMRDAESLDSGNANTLKDLMAERRIANKDFYNLSGVLLDQDVDENTEFMEIKFGSSAYFDLIFNRADLKLIFADTKYVIVIVNSDANLAVIIRGETGSETLTDNDKKRLW